MNLDSSAILDLILLAVLFICAIRGYLDGFFTSVLKLCGTFGSFIAAWYVSSHYSQAIFDKVFRESFIERTYNYFLQTAGSISVGDAVKNIIGSLPEAFVNIIIGKTEMALTTILYPSREMAETFVDSVISPIAVSFISIVVLVVLFVALTLLCHLLAGLLKKVNDAPVLGKRNKICGFLVGIINGGIDIIILSFLISIIIVVTKDSLGFLNSRTVEQSRILALTALINPLI